MISSVLAVWTLSDPYSATRPRPVDPDLVSRPPTDAAREIERIGPAVASVLQGPHRRSLFEAWEAQGIHVTPVDYYQPIPDTRTLSEDAWERPSRLRGITMNESEQLRLLLDVFPKFKAEYNKFPREPDAEGAFYLGNGMFDGTDALIYYCMIRFLRPRLIIEVGSGFSAQIALSAAERNGPTEIVAVDPYPSTALEKIRPSLGALHVKRAQDVDVSFFRSLDDGDILFIDSSHVSRIGSDVNYLILDVLPELRPGVAVHFHDIFWPFEYPREWVLDDGRFWNEQYLLQAFLAFNIDYHIMIANNYLASRHRDVFRAVFPRAPWWGGGSVWLRRSRGGGNSQRSDA
jgi:Methyltransferase domain